MKNLMEMALTATKNNVVKSTKKENVNDSLVRILLDDGKKLSRTHLIAHISLDRLISEHGEKHMESIDQNEFDTLMKATNKTVKNGLDTAISKSNNNSSFHYNEKYKGMLLAEVKGLWTITLRK